MRARLLVAALALVVLSACEVRVRVAIDADTDGSGTLAATVTLDRAAAEQVGDLRGRLRVDDLRRAGWVVRGPEPVPGERGAVRVTASHRFSDGDELAELTGQLSGETGPFRSFRVERRRTFARTHTSFSGVVDLAGGVEAFADERLAEQAGGAPFGAPAADLERRLGVVLARIFRFQVVADLPGSMTANAPSVGDRGAVWAPRLGQRVELTASAATWNTTNLAAAVGAAVFAVLAVVTALRARRIGRRRRSADAVTPPP